MESGFEKLKLLNLRITYYNEMSKSEIHFRFCTLSI